MLEIDIKNYSNDLKAIKYIMYLQIIIIIKTYF